MPRGTVPHRKADSYTDGQEIPYMSRICHSIHTIPPEDLTKNQLTHSTTLTPLLSKIHVNIIFLSASRSPKWSPPFRVTDLHPARTVDFSHACYVPSLPHPACLITITVKLSAEEQIMKPLFM